MQTCIQCFQSAVHQHAVHQHADICRHTHSAAAIRRRNLDHLELATFDTVHTDGLRVAVAAPLYTPCADHGQLPLTWCKCHGGHMKCCHMVVVKCSRRWSHECRHIVVLQWLQGGVLVQVDSLQEMDAKIDDMARSGALDPALLLTLAKAHTSVKDTDYTREEVKDVMAHLYFKVSPAQPPITTDTPQ